MNIDDINNELISCLANLNEIFNGLENRYRDSNTVKQAFKSIQREITRASSECVALHKVLSMPKNTRFYYWNEDTQSFQKLNMAQVYKHAHSLTDLT